jgi:hypothetical protein
MDAERNGDTLRVYHRDREVNLVFDPVAYKFRIDKGDKGDWGDWYDATDLGKLVDGVYHAMELSDYASQTWQRFAKDGKCPFNPWEWSRRKFYRLINWAIYPHYKQLTQGLDTPAARLSRRLFSVAGRGDMWLVEEILKGKDPYLYDDIMNDRKWAFAARTFRTEVLREVMAPALANRSFRRSTVPGQLPTGVFSKVVDNATLLKRPIHTRYEWLAFAGLCEDNLGVGANIRIANPLALETFWRSTEGQLRKAYLILAEAWQMTLKRPKAQSIFGAYRNFAETPLNYIGRNSTVVGLAEACLKYHYDLERKEMAHRQAELEIIYPELPIPAPADPRITYLSSGQMLYDEGVAMRHCCFSYHWHCADGRSYIFSFKDEELGRATVEVDRLGNLIQSRGVQNHNTEAARVASRIMGKWARKLTEHRARDIATEKVQAMMDELLLHQLAAPPIDEQIQWGMQALERAAAHPFAFMPIAGD